MRSRMKVVIILFMLVLGKVYSGLDIQEKTENLPMNKDTKHIVLLGASVGKHWEISKLPERTGHAEYVFEYIHGGGFDKSQSLYEILARKENRPDGIFLKECAAYFPGDFKHQKELMIKWIKACLEQGVIPIPTTVVPVTRLHLHNLCHRL